MYAYFAGITFKKFQRIEDQKMTAILETSFHSMNPGLGKPLAPFRPYVREPQFDELLTFEKFQKNKA
jgi:hypothetical protein